MPGLTAALKTAIPQPHAEMPRTNGIHFRLGSLQWAAAQLLHNVAKDQRTLAGLGMQLHDRMLCLEQP